MINYLTDVIEEAFMDYRWAIALSVDAYGAASIAGYLTGAAPGLGLDGLDLVTGAAQSAIISKLYGDDFGKWENRAIMTLSWLEEAGPFITDIIPSATIAHVYAAAKRVNRRNEYDKEQERIKRNEMLNRRRSVYDRNRYR